MDDIGGFHLEVKIVWFCSLGRTQFGHEHTREVSPEGRISHTNLSQITYRNREVCLFP